MSDLLFWRELTLTDFNAINGLAAPSGTGGGAMHIALGVDRPKFPIKDFLQTKGSTATITAGSKGGVAPLTFDGNPARRGGEWRITDQYNHRHPAWTTAQGFPATYNSSDPPVILVARLSSDYLASFKMKSEIGSHLIELNKLMKSRSGITEIKESWYPALGLNSAAQTELAAIEALPGIVPPFDPSSEQDGRKKILSEVVRRQGQAAFRKKLFDAYDSKCAITGCSTQLVLEAAHISPYRGASTNHVTNGVLLRADIHTLFDLNLITIDKISQIVRVSSLLVGSEYCAFEGKLISLPSEAKKRPSPLALDDHNARFRP